MVVIISISSLVNVPIFLVGKKVFEFGKEEKYFKSSSREWDIMNFLKTI